MEDYIGDKGKTHLFGGKKVDKDSMRIEVIGSIDELNSFVGLARSRIEDKMVNEILEKIQRDLFAIGADIASPKDSAYITRLIEKDVEEIEGIIKDVNEDLAELKGFILPSGSPEASLIHICRSICRRAERRLVALKKEESINDIVMVYINRLSDLFFSLARYMNSRKGVHDELWKDDD